MKFDSLVVSILNETTSKKIPVLDGQREVYFVTTKDLWPIDGSAVQDVKRMSVNGVVEFYFDKQQDGMGHGTYFIGEDDYQPMITALKEWFNNTWESNKQHRIEEVSYDEGRLLSVPDSLKFDCYNEFLKRLKPLSDLKFKRCKVFKYLHRITVAVEIDTEHYRIGGLQAIAGDDTTDDEGSIMSL